MGTYTTNYNLFMPTVGEQGWGELVNGNFSTIDTTMKGLNTRMGIAESNITSLTSRMGTAETTVASNKSRIGTLETEMDAVEERVTVFEDNISFNSNGDIVGNIMGRLYIPATTSTVQYNGDVLYATCNTQTLTVDKNSSGSITVEGYSKISLEYPYQLCPGVSVPSANYFNDTVPNSFERNLIFELKASGRGSMGTGILKVNGVEVFNFSIDLGASYSGSKSDTTTVKNGDVIAVTTTGGLNSTISGVVTIEEKPKYYINF